MAAETLRANRCVTKAPLDCTPPLLRMFLTNSAETFEKKGLSFWRVQKIAQEHERKGDSSEHVGTSERWNV